MNRSPPENAAAVSEWIREGPRSVAPALETGGSALRIRTTWQKQLLAHLGWHKRHPGGATRRTGQVTLAFVRDRLGHVVPAAVVTGSGDPALDGAALAMMGRSDPVPPPALVADDGLAFSIPVMFHLEPPVR